MTDNTRTEISCAGNGIFKKGSSNFVAQDYRCQKANLVTPKKMNIKCGDNGSIFHFGFALPNIFVKLYETCYSVTSRSSFYAIHTLHGSSIKNKMPNKFAQFEWNAFGVPVEVDISNVYSHNSQQARFTKLLNVNAVQRFYNKPEDHYFSRGHLNPNGDQLFTSWRKATFYLLNTVPEWQIINSKNIVKVEEIVRKQADRLKKDLKVLTGGFEVLRSSRKIITLHANGINVPKWLWKVVVDETTKEMIAFVTLNDPHLTQDPASSTLLCPDVCTTLGWYIDERKKRDQGYTICCRVSELKKKISYIPVAYSGKDMRYKTL